MWTPWLGSVAPRPPSDTANVCQSSQPHSVRANPIHPWHPATLPWGNFLGFYYQTFPFHPHYLLGFWNPLDPWETISAHWRLAGEFPYTCLAVIFHVTRKSLHLQESGRRVYRCCRCPSLHVVGQLGDLSFMCTVNQPSADHRPEYVFLVWLDWD